MRALSNYKKCRQYLNKNVFIKTKHGSYRGKIVKVDKKKVYLRVSSFNNGKKVRTSFFFPFIIPLVLFDLLVIALLETKPRRLF